MKLRSLVAILATAAFGLFVVPACGGDSGGGESDTVGTDTNGGDNVQPDGACTPACTNDDGSARACGPDGCGGTCGTCAAGQTCDANGACTGEVCTPACDGKVCGPDGCEGSCGSCATGQTCDNGQCVNCTPACDGKTCGPDGCGGTCGTCPTGQVCNAGGTCDVCTPACTGKACGPDGCGGSCGTCDSGFTCDDVSGACKAAPVGLGGVCGPDAACPYPADTATDAEVQDWLACLNSQCADELCMYPYGDGNPFCSAMCTISKDQVNNTTGAAGSDGIEDADTPNNGCGGGTDGLVGANFRCVNISSNPAQPIGICYPGTALNKCDSNDDCVPGEICHLTSVMGQFEKHCQTAIKGGVTEIAEPCNGDPNAGDVVFCANNWCFSIGCSAFCTADSQCQTANACQGGTCANNPAVTCTNDTDCSAWECHEDMQIFSDGGTEDVCFPKTCLKESDCPDSAFYCRPFIADTQDKFEGSCTMKPANVVEFGEPCDENPDDNIPGPICVNPYMCLGGYCGGLCTADADCATDKDQKCAVIFEYDFDADEDGTTDALLPLWGCQTFPGAAGDCDIPADCADGKTCSWAEFGFAAGQFSLSGTCVDENAAAATTGTLCSNAVYDITADGTDVTLNTSESVASCQTGLCLGMLQGYNETYTQLLSYGLCSETCNTRTDCPETVTVEGTVFKTVCRALLWSQNGTLENANDDLFLPVCWTVGDTNTLTDCSADRYTCGEGEACNPFVIASTPDKPGSVDWVCLATYNGTIALGGECNPNPPLTVGNPPAAYEGPYCATDVCLPDVQKDKGYCSKFCTTDADCTALGADFVCHNYPYVNRVDDANDVYVPRCQKAASCIPCVEDADCTDGYSCVNAGGIGFLANYRCAPTCTVDGDCAGTDGGATCKESKDDLGNAEGKKACIPASCN
jgi:hypothetical protein